MLLPRMRRRNENASKHRKKPFDKIIAVDGGLKRLRQAGIVPDLIAGDFDSLGFKPETGKLLCLPVEKDVTDSYAAACRRRTRGLSA